LRRAARKTRLVCPTLHHRPPSCPRRSSIVLPSREVFMEFLSAVHNHPNQSLITHLRLSKTRSITRSAHSRCASTNKPSSTTRPRSNSCSCLFLVTTLVFPSFPTLPRFVLLSFDGWLTFYFTLSSIHARARAPTQQIKNARRRCARDGGCLFLVRQGTARECHRTEFRPWQGTGGRPRGRRYVCHNKLCFCDGTLF
jgi:hypothetical protein